MITIENRDDYITMTRLLRKSRIDHIRIKIMGNEYLLVKNEFTNLHNRSIHDMHFNAYMYINNCAIVARAMPSIKKRATARCAQICRNNQTTCKFKKRKG